MVTTPDFDVTPELTPAPQSRIAMFLTPAGNPRRVSADDPLPVTAIGGGGALGLALESTLQSLFSGAAQYHSAAAEPVASIKASGGTLDKWSCYNSGAVKCYLQIHNLAAAPTGGETPWLVIGEIDTGEAESDSYPYALSAGIQLALSTTLATYTSPGNVGYFHAWRD